jgi:hypothetical protein
MRMRTHRRCLSAIVLLMAACDGGREVDGRADPQQLVDQLSAPGTATAAAAALVALGGRAVPVLRGYLSAGDVGDLPARSAALAAYALGCIGVAAVEAQPEVQRLFRFHADVDVRRQAAWCIARIVAPTRDAQRCRECAQFLHDFGAADVGQGDYAWSLSLLALGEDGREEVVQSFLEDGGAAAFAALSEAIVTGWIDSPTALVDFRSRMVALRAHGYRRWRRNGSDEGAWAAMARACWQHGERSPDAALGLLRHQDAAWRIAGMAAIASTTNWQDQVEILALLDDPVAAVQQNALAIVKSWGAALIALPRLRNIAARHGPLRADFAAAAAEIVREAVATLDERAADVVRSADAVLCGEPIQLVAANDASAYPVWLDLVRGSRDASPTWLTALGDVAPAIAEHADGGDAFVGLLASTAPDSWHAAITTLARCGPALLRTEPGIEKEVYESRGRVGAALFVGMELRAGALASEADLAAAAADGAWHLVARARLELVQRQADISRGVVRRARTGVHGGDGIVEWSSGSFTYRPEPSLAQPAAALLLVAANETGWRDAVAPATAEALVQAAGERQLPQLSAQWIRELQAWARGQDD